MRKSLCEFLKKLAQAFTLKTSLRVRWFRFRNDQLSLFKGSKLINFGLKLFEVIALGSIRVNDLLVLLVLYSSVIHLVVC